MDCNAQKKNKKRKRTMNTTREQYELYLSTMESDYAIRSGTINPTLGDNYLSEKWEELSNKLNAIGSGPKLTPDEWKKRFTDWKYNTRNKFRKKSEHMKATGSGPQSDITLNELEERALSVWGKITVTGNEKNTKYEGIESNIILLEDDLTKNNCKESNKNINNSNNIAYILEFENENSEIYPSNVLDDENNTSNCEQSTNIINPVPGTRDMNSKQEINKTTPTSSKETGKLNKSRKYLPPRPKPLSVLTEKLLEINNDSNHNLAEFNSILNKFTDSYIKVEQEKLELEKNKLRLEIAKLKFLNPEFNFDI